MMFDKYYDRALWLILQGDKKNRKLINIFINNLTDEMYECIYNLQKECSKEHSVTSIHSELMGDDFRLLVQINGTILTIILNKFDITNQNGLGESYELSLLPIVDDFFENKKINSVKIGSFSYKKTKVLNQQTGYAQMSTVEDIFYRLNSDENKCILTTLNSSNYEVLSSKRVDISMIPEKIYPHCFQVKKGKCRTRKK